MDLFQAEASRVGYVSSFLVAAALIVFVMINASSIIIPIIVAIGIWFVLNNLTEVIHRQKIVGYQLPRLFSMIIGLLLVSFLVLRVGGIFTSQVPLFLDQQPRYQDNLTTLLDSVPTWVWRMAVGNEAEMVPSGLDILVEYGGSYFSQYISTLAANAANIASQLLVVVVYVIFLLLEQGTFGEKVRHMFTHGEHRDEAVLILTSIQEQIQTYISVKALVSFVTALVSYGIMMSFDLAHSIVWAILIFILNFIPNIGSVIAIIFPVLMAVLQYPDNWGRVLTIFGTLSLVQMVVGNFVEPRLMGNRLNISPFVVLVSLAVFGAIWGVIGMFLSVPLTVILMIVFSHFDTTRPLAVLLSGNGHVHGIEMHDLSEG